MTIYISFKEQIHHLNFKKIFFFKISTLFIFKFETFYFQSCQAPRGDDDLNQGCAVCSAPGGVRRELVNGSLKVSKVTPREFEFGLGIVLTLSTRNSQYSCTIFTTSPLIKEASSLAAGDRCQVRGWVEKYGELEVIKAYALKKKVPVPTRSASASDPTHQG